MPNKLTTKKSPKKSAAKKVASKKKAVRTVTTARQGDPLENMLQSMYVITEHWKSDLRFFNDELAFLTNLADNHFTHLISETYDEDTRKAVSALMKLEEKRLQMEHKTESHLHHLTNLIENPFPYNAQVFKDEHEKLENTMTSFVKEFQEVKRKMFKLTEHVLESEKVKSLLRLTENSH